MMQHLRSLAGERAVGTDWNNQIIRFLEKTMQEAGCTTSISPFSCLRWESKTSWCGTTGERLQIHPSPFSLPCQGTFPAVAVDSPKELFQTDITRKAVVFHGELAEEPLMPKDFPFYYPEEHRRINDYLEKQLPAAVLSCTGKHPSSGLTPFALFEDGAIVLASASASREHLRKLLSSRELAVSITSKRVPAGSAQLTGMKPGGQPKKIVLCAHMDTAYHTPGALDNAAGVSVMLRVMELLQDIQLNHRIEYVPFNGEEYFAASGQLAYLAENPEAESEIALVINVDGCGYRGSQSAFSLYNMDESAAAHLQQVITADSHCEIGPQWFQGDHAPFVFKGIPCAAVTSGNLAESVMEISHTEHDTLEMVDADLLSRTAGTVAELIQKFDRR